MDAFLKFLKSVEDEVPLRKVPTGILRMFFQAGRDSAVKELKTPGKVLIDEDMPEHGVTNPARLELATPRLKGACSNQLSYGGTEKWWTRSDSHRRPSAYEAAALVR